MTIEPPTKLFGPPGAEVLWASLEECISREFPIIEEWTVTPPEDHLPEATHMASFLLEWICECGSEETSEGWYENFSAMVLDTDPVIVEAMDKVRSHIASLITYRMADRQVAQYTFTYEDDQPKGVVSWMAES